MSTRIKVIKGLNLNLEGEAEKVLFEADKSAEYMIKPTDFHRIAPKMEIKEGEEIVAGQPIFSSKDDQRIKFVSPVNGVLKEIKRGTKRKILSVSITANTSDAQPIKHSLPKLSSADATQIKETLLASGCWAFIKQRPYDVIAHPDETPKSIFISAYATAPLTACLEYTLKDKQKEFQKGVEVLSKITSGDVHLSVDANSISYYNELESVVLHKVDGPHPAGNVGVQIHSVDPINPNEKVWVVTPQDVAIIGGLFSTGVLEMSRIVAIAGSSIKKPCYKKIKIGAIVSSFLEKIEDNTRIISGNVLSGDKVSLEESLGYYADTLTVIPEGNQYRMLGWMPFKDNHIPSFYATSFYKLSNMFSKKKSVVNTNINGEERALVITGKMEKVFPFEIYPMQLIKECLANNIEKMEHLGIYEVVPEDFGLIDYISTSKIEAQDIVRKALDLMIEEVG